MRLFMKGNVEKSLRDFDDGLERFFSTSRKYRSTIRRGSIVLLDKKMKMFEFFTYLVRECGLEVGVVHVEEAASAKKAIGDIGAYDVKAVVIDSEMLGESLNGDSLPSWLAKNYPRIPIWVINCAEEKKNQIRSQSRRVGIIEESATLETVAETVGFPEECQKVIAHFAL